MVEFIDYLSQRSDAQVAHKIEGSLPGLGRDSVNLKDQRAFFLENPESGSDKSVSKVELATHADVLVRGNHPRHRSQVEASVPS